MRGLLFLLMVLPVMAQGGAWPRGEGQAFLSFALEGSDDGIIATAFAEYGLTEQLTFGLDAVTSFEDDSATFIAFARYSFPARGPHVFAVSGGLGAEYRVDTREEQLTPSGPVTLVDEPKLGGFLRAGLHYGRGFENGWFALDASHDWGTLESDTTPALPDVEISRTKLDATLGYRLSDEFAVIGQAFLFRDQFGTLRSAFLGGIFERGAYSLEVGVKQSFDAGDTALKLGVWRQF
ncbi:MAG: hypothetical protein AAFZ02_09630 [Pseudomonadota bacterium]